MTFGAQQEQQQTVNGRPPGRGRARRLVPLGVAVWAVLEIWLLVLVAGAAGGLTVFALLAGGVITGAYVIKRAGRRAWQRLSGSFQQGAASRSPKAPPQDGEGGGNGLTMLGGLLLMVPGLISDVAGLLCLFPPTRALIRRTAERKLTGYAAQAAPGTLGDAFQQAQRARMRQPDGKVVQGEVIREDQPPAPRPDDPQLPR
ncbi:FxsA family protein [Streptomyces luteoverticillatus]|uniref:FxsA family protein n=1 Tax=Streptomyces luteoverticillatus TaxID=66425 RepID=A0A3Q9FUU4_STRLT|nr:FxsA family membrane protein [Streptomyces luteoverticillatus]AZQ70659.1 FxsA family protein [Streptomyces luteoverticillatus]